MDWGRGKVKGKKGTEGAESCLRPGLELVGAKLVHERAILREFVGAQETHCSNIWKIILNAFNYLTGLKGR